jgi:phosphonate transport system substrate-binding protein
LLAEKIHIKINPVYVNGHQNVYRQVILGEAAAGGGVKKTLGKEAKTVQSELKVIFSTPEIASHPLAAHPRVPVSVSNKIAAALIAMRNDPETGKLLAAVQLPQPVVADFKRDYSGLVKLRLDRYAVSQTQ